MKVSSILGRLDSMIFTRHRGRVKMGIALVIAAGTLVSSGIGPGIAVGARAEAQMLARPGWQGSGLATETWWRHPVIYEIDARTFAAKNADGVTGLKGIVEHLDYLRTLGVDAILLDSLDPAAASAGTAGGESTAEAVTNAPATPITTVPIDPSLGTLDDFDMLSLEASRRNIRVLLNLNATGSTATTLATSRFWLNRGVAGFHRVPDPQRPTSPETLVALRQLLHSFFGGRILIKDAAVAATPPTSESAAAARPSARLRNRHVRAGAPSASSETAAVTSPAAAQLVLLSSLLQLPSAQASGSQQQAAIAVATELHSALEGALSLPSNELPLLATDAGSRLPSVTRFYDALRSSASAPGGTATNSSPSSEPTSVEESQIAKLVATVLLGTRSSALIDQGQEIGLSGSADAAATSHAGEGRSIALPWSLPPAPKPLEPGLIRSATHSPKPAAPGTIAAEEADAGSLLNFYRQLAALHHGNTAMRDGETILLDHSAEGVVAWVRRPKTPSLLTPATVVLLNLSAAPTTLSLKAELTRLQLRGSFLRTVLRSDSGMGSMNLTSMTLPPYTVYIGEVRY